MSSSKPATQKVAVFVLFSAAFLMQSAVFCHFQPSHKGGPNAGLQTPVLVADGTAPAPPPVPMPPAKKS
jgi:hypothetical protein